MKAVFKIWALILLTAKESLAKKTFMTFFILSTLVHLFFIFALDANMVEGAFAMVTILGQEITDIEKMIMTIETIIATMVFFGGIIFSIFATASLIPSMLEKGTIELLVSKPLTRWQLICGRFLGAQIIMIFNVVYLIAGNWLILSVKTGFWNVPYLLSIPLVVFTFAVMYALTTLAGLLTRSSGVSVMVAFIVLIFSPLLAQKDNIYPLLSKKFYYHILNFFYHILPKTFELSEINKSLVTGEPVTSWSALWSTGIAGLGMLALAIGYFSRKDF